MPLLANCGPGGGRPHATSQKGAGKKEAGEEPAWNRDGRRRIRGRYNDHHNMIKMIKMIKMMSLSKRQWKNDPKKFFQDYPSVIHIQKLEQFRIKNIKLLLNNNQKEKR